MCQIYVSSNGAVPPYSFLLLETYIQMLRNPHYLILDNAGMGAKKTGGVMDVNFFGEIAKLLLPAHQGLVTSILLLISAGVFWWDKIQKLRWSYEENGEGKALPGESLESTVVKTVLGKIGREAGGHVAGLKHHVERRGFRKVLVVTYPEND